MERYVDGFLIPVAADRIDRYCEIANIAATVWMDHGALEYYECVGDDLDNEGTVSFERSAAATAGEKVIFAWIVYESRAHRDKVNAAVMADPRMQPLMSPDGATFDCARMAYGGFRTLVVR